ncbi:kinase-like domain-containing protein, partial [Armillaria luteobubalina]
TDGEDFFYFQSTTRRSRGEDDTALAALSRQAILVPCSLHQISPPLVLTRAPQPLPDDCYVKVGRMLHFHPEDLDKSAVWPLMIKEAQVCEILMNHPHRNVTRYYGYVEKDGLMTGLYYKRYRQTLDDAVKKGAIPRSDIESSLDQIKEGIDHLHGLGLVHNNINPSNIMLDTDSTLVIIDFDSCRKPGESMLEGKYGTFPFSNEETTSTFENDFYGVEKTHEWMDKFYDEQVIG